MSLFLFFVLLVIVYDSSLAKKVDKLQQQVDEQEDMLILTGTAVVEGSAQSQRRYESMKTTVNNQGKGMQTLDEKTETNVEDVKEVQRENQAQIHKNTQEISKLNFYMELLALTTFILLFGAVLVDLIGGFYSKINIINLVLLALAVIFWLPAAFDSIYLVLKSNCSCFPNQEKWQLLNAVKDCVLNLIMTCVTGVIGGAKLFNFSKSEKYIAIIIDSICVLLLCVLIGGSLYTAFIIYGNTIRLSNSEINTEPSMAVTDNGGTSDTNENETGEGNTSDRDSGGQNNGQNNGHNNGHSSDSSSSHRRGKKNGNHSNSGSKDFHDHVGDMIYPSSASDVGSDKAVNVLNTRLIEKKIEKKRKDVGLPVKNTKTIERANSDKQSQM